MYHDEKRKSLGLNIYDTEWSFTRNGEEMDDISDQINDAFPGFIDGFQIFSSLVDRIQNNDKTYSREDMAKLFAERCAFVKYLQIGGYATDFDCVFLDQRTNQALKETPISRARTTKKSKTSKGPRQPLTFFPAPIGITETVITVI